MKNHRNGRIILFRYLAISLSDFHDIPGMMNLANEDIPPAGGGGGARLTGWRTCANLGNWTLGLRSNTSQQLSFVWGSWGRCAHPRHHCPCFALCVCVCYPPNIASDGVDDQVLVMFDSAFVSAFFVMCMRFVSTW